MEFIYIIYVVSILIYIIGIFTYVYTETIKDVEFHDGGFLNMGYTTHLNRDATPKDVRMGLLWPIFVVFWFVKAVGWMLNDLVAFVLLIFNYRYKETKVYEFIDRTLGRNL